MFWKNILSSIIGNNQSTQSNTEDLITEVQEEEDNTQLYIIAASVLVALYVFTQNK